MIAESFALGMARCCDSLDSRYKCILAECFPSRMYSKYKVEQCLEQFLVTTRGRRNKLVSDIEDCARPSAGCRLPKSILNC